MHRHSELLNGILKNQKDLYIIFMCIYVGSHEYVCYDHMAEVRGQGDPICLPCASQESNQGCQTWQQVIFTH